MSEAPHTEAITWETTACPLCGESRSQAVCAGTDLLYGCPGEFTLARCDGCGHVFLNPRPTRESIGRYYPSDYGPFRRDNDAGEQGGVSPPVHSPQNRGADAAPLACSRIFQLSPRSWRWLKRLVLWWIDSRAAPIPKSEISNLKFQRPQRALELGCAHGSFLEQLRLRGWNCVGVEPAAEVAAHAVAHGFDVRTGSLEDAVRSDTESFAPSSFDAVFAWMVVEHLHDPVSTLKLARELLAPGGRLLLSVPNDGCWEPSFFGRCWYALQLPTHLQHFRPATLRQLLEASGFELIELIHQRNVNNLVGSVGLWLRTKFPRWSLGERLIRWTDNPSALGLCLLAPLSRCLAMLRQSGRLTVVARRPLQS